MSNESFEQLMRHRYSKEAIKTQLRMKTVRHEVDDAYRTIIDRTNALIIVKPFILDKTINSRWQS